MFNYKICFFQKTKCLEGHSFQILCLILQAFSSLLKSQNKHKLENKPNKKQSTWQNNTNEQGIKHNYFTCIEEGYL